ncbi:MAG: histone H1-like repetitive region-containing protein [Nannocystaceae bacterium]
MSSDTYTVIIHSIRRTTVELIGQLAAAGGCAYTRSFALMAIESCMPSIDSGKTTPLQARLQGLAGTDVPPLWEASFHREHVGVFIDSTEFVRARGGGFLLRVKMADKRWLEGLKPGTRAGTTAFDVWTDDPKSPSWDEVAEKIGVKKKASTSTGAKKAAVSKTGAKKTAASETAGKKTAAKKEATKKTASKKTASKKTASKKRASKKTASKKTASKKTASKATSSKTASKTTSSSKTASKKTASKETTSSKTASKKTGKKAAPKKAAAKKPASKKPTAKTTTARKTTAKRSKKPPA